VQSRELTLGQEPPATTSRGIVVWVIAAASLVVGIVIGFTSGYAAGQRNGQPGTPNANLETGPRSPEPGTEDQEIAAQSFSEQSVEPTRVAPEDVVLSEDRPDRSEGLTGTDRSDASDASTVQDGSNVSNPSTRSGSLGAGDPNDLRPGSVSVMSRPSGAQVILDGRVVGRTPLVIPNVTPGTHSVRLELAGFTRWATSVDVNAGARARVAASLEQP
jgi:hypothetical protein